MVVTNLTMLILFSIFYMFGVLFIYFSKTRLKSEETKIYSLLIISNIIGLFLQLLCDFVSFKYDELSPIFCDLIFRLYLIYFVVWTTLIFIYLIEISFKNKKKIVKLAIFGAIIVAAGALLLPYDLYRNMVDKIYYTYNGAVTLVFAYAGIIGMFMFAILIFKRKNISKRKAIPLWIFIISSLLLTYIQMNRPEFVVMAAMESFICCMMYFTIENPDVQMINELYKNKKLIEKSNEDTSRFLFRITQDIRRPVEEISDISNDMKTLNTKEEFIEASKYINNYSNQVDYLINKALNISNMDTQTIKIFENKYNPRNLFKEVSFRALENKNDNIKFSYQLSNSLPNYLYGDSIKLKQTLSSIINIAYSYTSSGFVNMDVSTIIKYGICRLVITIEDSGRGISIDRINEILSMTGSDLKSVNISNNDNCYLDIISVKKLVNMLGGSLMIKSEENKGTVVTITLDQRIVKDKSTELSKKLERYEQSLYGDKKALVIDSDEKELVLISDVLQKSGITVSSSVYAKDCIENIRSKMKYDFIILDDVLSDSSAYDVLKEISKNKNFKIPVIVMISDNKEGIKLHYMKDGFFDCIMKSKLDSELERILKRF